MTLDRRHEVTTIFSSLTVNAGHEVAYVMQLDVKFRSMRLFYVL